MVLRDEENRVATRTFFVNEARGDKQPTVAWRALRGREATCGQAVLWGWELVRDVEPGDEVLTTYEEDASGMPETRPDERSGTADALASIGGVPRNLRGCGCLRPPARAARAPSTVRPGIEDRHLQIAVRESLRDAKAAKLRVPGCPCRDLETGQRMQGNAGRRQLVHDHLRRRQDGVAARGTTRAARGAVDRRAGRGARSSAPPTPPPAPAAAGRPPPADAAAVPHLPVSSDGDRARAAERGRGAGHPGAGRGGAIDPRRRSRRRRTKTPIAAVAMELEPARRRRIRRSSPSCRSSTASRRLVRGVRPRARRISRDRGLLVGRPLGR